jgi:hypothetical protein
VLFLGLASVYKVFRRRKGAWGVGVARSVTAAMGLLVEDIFHSLDLNHVRDRNSEDCHDQRKCRGVSLL